jgi:hypothetical protein
MTFLITIAQLALVWLGACLMGLAMVKVLLPPEVEREHGLFLMPTTGVLALCLASFTVSATFDMPTASAVRACLAALLLAGLATQLRKEWRIRPGDLLRDLRTALLLAAPMALAILWPFFWYGAKTYLGSVNPDFYAGLIDIYYLLQGHSITTFEAVRGDSAYPVLSAAGYGSASARFGSELFVAAVHETMGLDLRASLTLTIAFSLLCLPLTLYSLCRLVLGFEARAARIAAWLIGISASVGMSYLYFYLGQNAGLPALPLVLTAVYLMLTRPAVGTLAYCALLANGLFVNYFAMLPYALAPAGPLWLYLVFTRRLSLRTALLIVLGFVAISAGLIAGNLPATFESMRMWLGVIGQSLQGQYFLDFLTESFFSYFFGVYNYQHSPWAAWLMGQIGSRVVGFGVAVACAGVLAWSIRRWNRDQPDTGRRVFVFSTLLIYFAVWALYSFSRQYGYAVFKMSSWLQFILVPFMAYAIDKVMQDRRSPAPAARSRALSTAAVATLCLYVALNFAANVQYAYNGLGRNKDTGYIVNHFGMSGNETFFELPSAVAKFVKPDESIGMLFTDSIRNWWTSYYIKEFRQSFLSHWLMPGDDENLPDLETNVVVDYYGNVERLRNDFFHGGAADQYILTWNKPDLNRDIVATDFTAKALWENSSFRLFRADDVHDLLFTGRGFYRLEYFKPVEYFFPEVLRWSADGGEFYVLHPGQPGAEYRLAFDAIVGYEYPNDSRTLEFYQDGRKFGETRITHSARVVSPAFKPRAGTTKLVVYIKEKNRSLPRPFALWNKEIPADYRRLNIAFSNARLVAPGAPSAPPPPLGRPITFLQLMRAAESFDGFQLDGWIGERAQVSLPVPRGATQVEVTGLVPGNMGFAFPFKVALRIDGRDTEIVIPNAGDFKLVAPLGGQAASAGIAIVPGESREVGEVEIRHKVIRRSLRIDSLTFR